MVVAGNGGGGGGGGAQVCLAIIEHRWNERQQGNDLFNNIHERKILKRGKPREASLIPLPGGGWMGI